LELAFANLHSNRYRCNAPAYNGSEETTMAEDSELLIGLSDDELEALAESKLAPANQDRLDALLAVNAEGKLSPPDEVELDRLLARVDQLNILKARARYTLHRKSAASAP
jgi:hypothetical protein